MYRFWDSFQNTGKLSGNRFQPTFRDKAGRFFFYSLDSPYFLNYLIGTLINIILLDRIFVKHPDEHLQLCLLTLSREIKMHCK